MCFLFSERLLFIPSVGFCFIVADLLTIELFGLWRGIRHAFVPVSPTKNSVVSSVSIDSSMASSHTSTSKSSSPSSRFSSPSTDRQCSTSATSYSGLDSLGIISAVNIALIPILLLFAVRVVTRNVEWNHEPRMYRAALSVCPHSVKALNKSVFHYDTSHY